MMCAFGRIYRVFSSSFRKNARLAMRLIRWQHWLVLKLRNSTTGTPPLGCRVERDAPAGYVRPLIEPYVQFSRIRLTVWNI